MLKKYLFICFFIGSSFLIANNSKAQANDTPRLQISILTCDAGEDIYTAWGHTAIRVIDSVQGSDYVFNYGTFDFETPFFISKFVKGNLEYFISANYYADFYAQYQYEKRNIKEQVLNLSATEKIRWYQGLKKNMMGKNKYYLYNFITDNCTTRVKDGLFNFSHYVPNRSQEKSFREKVVLAPYQKGIPWIGLGIDLLLGSFSDQKPTDQQAAFLPDLLFDQIAGIKKLVRSTNVSNFNNETAAVTPNTKDNSPLYILIGFLALYALSLFFKNKSVRVIASVTDVILLLAFTLGGSLIFYMSFVSNHTACFNNFNIMWMHPLYIIGLIAYFIKNEWISHIGKVFLGAVLGLVITSYWLPQQFSIEVFTLIAIALILNYRLIQRGQNNIQHKN